MEKFEESVLKEFARLDYAPRQVEKFDHLLHAVREFLQYAGGQQYYGDALNKRIFQMILESDDCSLELEKFALEAADYSDEVSKAVLLKRKPKIDQERFDKFKAEMRAFENRLKALCDECRSLIVKIREESRQKG